MDTPLDWRAVRSAASAPLKAFLVPAEAVVDGRTVRLRYAPRHRFHFAQMRAHLGELEALLARVAGPGWAVQLEVGPDPLPF